MFKTVMNLTQEILILNHLKAEGSISGVEAMALYKVRSLPRRIATLRSWGHDIKSICCEDNCGQRYVRYRLIQLAATVAKQQEMFTHV